MHGLDEIKKYCNRISQLISTGPDLSNRYLHTKFPKESFVGQLPDLHVVTTLSELLKIYKGVIMVVGQVCIDETEGLRDRFFVPVSRALWYYQQGATLEFDFVERFFPNIQKLIKIIRDSLKLPYGAVGKAISYFSPRSSGFPVHFDAYYNFIFQMDGTKRWLLHYNDNVIAPMQHYDLHEYPYIPAELDMYWNHKITPPVNMSQEGSIEELIPGSMLYLPRGCWHQTEASEFSVSLNITLALRTNR